MMKVYGIPNCDTVKKARAWLLEQGLDYSFHDFKKQGVPNQALAQWIEAIGLERLVNRKGTTWRQLSVDQQAALTQASSAQAVLVEHPSVIKRPVVEWPHGAMTVGFDAQTWASLR